MEELRGVQEDGQRLEALRQRKGQAAHKLLGDRGDDQALVGDHGGDVHLAEAAALPKVPAEGLGPPAAEPDDREKGPVPLLDRQGRQLPIDAGKPAPVVQRPRAEALGVEVVAGGAHEVRRDLVACPEEPGDVPADHHIVFDHPDVLKHAAGRHGPVECHDDGGLCVPVLPGHLLDRVVALVVHAVLGDAFDVADKHGASIRQEGLGRCVARPGGRLGGPGLHVLRGPRVVVQDHDVPRPQRGAQHVKAVLDVVAPFVRPDQVQSRHVWL